MEESDNNHQPLVRLRPKNDDEDLKISETVLRKRNRDLKGAADRAWVRAQAKQNVKRIRKIHLITSAEKTVLCQRQVALDKKRFLSISKQPPPKVSKRSSVVFAVRNTLRNASDETRDVLRELGLMKFYSGRFLPNTSEYLQKLRLVEPFVFFGHPTLETIRTLFLRRGCIQNKLDVSVGDDEDDDDDEIKSDEEKDMDEEEKRLWKQFGRRRAPRVTKKYAALSDNSRIEEDLGHLGLLCVEDLIDHTYRCGPHFDEVMKYMGPFELSNLQKIEGLNAERSFTKGNIGLEINNKLMDMA